MKLKEEGFDVAYTEKLGQADIPAATRGYAEQGYELIFGHGFEFATAFFELAPEYPETSFFVATTPPEGELPANLQFYKAPHEYMAYMAGALAALISESHVVGFVGGADDPPNCHYSVAFTAGAEDTVPGTKALHVITGDYDDAARGREAAMTMIGNGADVIWHGANIAGLGAIAAVIESDKIAIGCYSDQSPILFSSFASSILLDATNLVYSRGKEFCAGSFEGGATWVPRFDEVTRYAFGEGAFNPDVVPADVIEKIENEILPALQDGTIKPPRCD